jgi:hypothetical protein
MFSGSEVKIIRRPRMVASPVGEFGGMPRTV